MIAPDDSVLGALSNWPHAGLHTPAMGCDIGDNLYTCLVKQAFLPKWWKAPGWAVDLSTSTPMIVPVGKGRAIKLAVTRDGQQPFHIAGTARKADVFRLKAELGGVAREDAQEDQGGVVDLERQAERRHDPIPPTSPRSAPRSAA